MWKLPQERTCRAEVVCQDCQNVWETGAYWSEAFGICELDEAECPECGGENLEATVA